MSAHAASPAGYSFVSYPGADYALSPGAYPGSPGPQMSAMAHMEFSGMQHHLPYSTHPHFPANLAFAHLGRPLAQGGPPSPIVTHALPPSPTHSGYGHSSHSGHSSQSPSSPDARNSSEMKVLRQLTTAMTKLQNTMKDLAERQEQILDRMSLLEQRVGRMDEGVERIMENTEAVMEDSRSIRRRVEESESFPFAAKMPSKPASLISWTVWSKS